MTTLQTFAKRNALGELTSIVLGFLLFSLSIVGEIAFFYFTISTSAWLTLAIGLTLPPVGVFYGLWCLLGLVVAI